MAQSFDAETYVNEILLKIQNHRNSGSVVVMGRAVPEQQNTSQAPSMGEFVNSLFNGEPLPTAQQRRAEIEHSNNRSDRSDRIALLNELTTYLQEMENSTPSNQEMENSTPTRLRLQSVLQKAIQMRETATQQDFESRHHILNAQDFLNRDVLETAIDMDDRRSRPNRVVSHGCASVLFNVLPNMFR